MSSRRSLVPRLLVYAALFAILASGCKGRTAAVSTPDPGGSYQIEWVSVTAPPSLQPAEVTTMDVSFRNSGATVISDEMLAISYHWMDGSDPKRPIVWDGLRTSVGRPVQPGETVSRQIRVRAPDRPGQYLLTVDLVREGVAWFSGRGSPPSSHPVTVQ
ncbi:MAG: hypothetical protein M3542_13290 [Acidobacteriota bacterium]|nr:hypothetical protein [Acidobacteriota bacterium]MDQ5872140.1 hypothetical protein [Acidobacteriota bacterium]